MTGTQIVQQMVEILVSGITGLGTGLGAGINNFVQALAVTDVGGTQAMSYFLTFTLVFCAISLGVGITRHVFLWLESLSARG